MAGCVLRILWLHAWCVYGALAVFVGLLACGVRALGWGTIKLPHPRILWNKYLRKDEWTFKKDMLYGAADAFEHNARLVNRLGGLTTVMVLLFGLEILLLVVWFVRGSV